LLNASEAPARTSVLVFFLFAALSIAWTWPLGAHIGSRIPADAGDPVLNTYLIWWNAATLPFTRGWWDPPFFFPMRGALALSEHLAGVAVISSPIQLFGGSPVLAYNVSLLASSALSGWFTYLLVRRLTGSTPAAICAGLAYGFAPFRAAQLAHLQVLTSQWLPLQLLGMHAYLEEGRRRWLGLAAVSWLIQGLSNGYYLLFTPVLVALWLFWFPRWRIDAKRGLTLVATLGVASVPFIPLLVKYREVHEALGLTRGAAEIVSLSATPASFVSPPWMLAFWPPQRVPAREDDLFPGITALLLIVAVIAVAAMSGRWRSAIRERAPLAFYAAAAVVMAALTFGPGGADAGDWRWIRPYFWLTLLPGFDALRVPARFAMLCALCTAVAAGVAIAHAMPVRRPWRALFIAAVAAGLMADGWLDPMRLVTPPGRQALAAVPVDAAILELPPDERHVNLMAMYRAFFHRRPLVNGYSGYFPPHFTILMQAVRRGDASPILELARNRPLAIIVNERFDPSGEFRKMVEALPGVAYSSSGNAGAMYLLPAQPRDRVAAAGEALPATVSTLPRAHVLLDLGTERIVRTIAFPLRAYYADVPRIAIETSPDARTWTTTWEGWIGGRALAGALEDPLLVPIRIPLPDVPARYVRIHPAPEWMIGELRILGP
jgi:hypothetical protein